MSLSNDVNLYSKGALLILIVSVITVISGRNNIYYLNIIHTYNILKYDY